MIVVIRGHIRNSFEKPELYDFVETIRKLFPELQIFIHTWNILANNISWRPVSANDTTVNKEMIHAYFGEMGQNIKHIIIDDDQNIKLQGKLHGNINNNSMPIIGWKNYWYGKYKIIDYLYRNEDIENDTPIINMRFDLFDNSNNFEKESLIEFIKSCTETQFVKNEFLFHHENKGIDNIYIGNINTMHALTHKFAHELDEILSRNPDIYHQEMLVYRINETLVI